MVTSAPQTVRCVRQIPCLQVEPAHWWGSEGVCVCVCEHVLTLTRQAGLNKSTASGCRFQIKALLINSTLSCSVAGEANTHWMTGAWFICYIKDRGQVNQLNMENKVLCSLIFFFTLQNIDFSAPYMVILCLLRCHIWRIIDNLWISQTEYYIFWYAHFYVKMC